MPSEYFNPTHSTDEIWRAQNMDVCLTDDLDTIEANIATLTSSVAGKVDATHVHTDYAATNHTHDGYALSVHSHTDYAEVNHTHSGYATAEHSHTGYASATDFARLQTLVGDTSVSSQIATAVASKADASHTHSEYASASHEHTGYAQADHVHSGYATESYVDSAVSNVDVTVDTALSATSTNPIRNNAVNSAISSLNTAVSGKASTSHTHNYAGSSSAGGAANSATKLVTARTIRTNLASTSTASFDGSANITPGVTGTLPIANGGTGATTAAAARTNLGVVTPSDYIVAQGTSGIWTYRKWNSGIAECWGNSTINYQIDCTTQRANAVYTDDTFKGTNASLPSGLFTSVSFATANVRTNGYSIAQVSNLSTTTLSYRVWCPYSTLLASGSVVEFHVKGRWK